MTQFFASGGQRICPSNENSGKILFRIDWMDLLALHESSPKYSSKASILRCSVFFIVQTSHPFMTTGKATALTIQMFVSRVMSLLFNSFVDGEVNLMHQDLYLGQNAIRNVAQHQQCGFYPRTKMHLWGLWDATPYVRPQRSLACSCVG